MTRVHGPMMSLAATGTLASTLTFQHAARGPVARMRPAPSQPQSASQIATRAIATNLSRQWSSLSAADKLTWEPQAALQRLSRYHAWFKYNLTRIHAGLGATQAYPPINTPSGILAVAYGYDVYNRTAWVRTNIILPRPNLWYITLHASPTLATPSHRNMIKTIPAYYAGMLGAYVGPYPPGNMYFQATYTSKTGLRQTSRSAPCLINFPG